MTPELAPQPGELVVTKFHYDGFNGTPLDAALRSRGVTHLVLTGTMTDICVLATVVGAFNESAGVFTAPSSTMTNPGAPARSVPVFPGSSGRMARPLAASRAMSACSRTAAPARSRHQPSGREPITLATSTTIVTGCPPIPISSAP